MRFNGCAESGCYDGVALERGLRLRRPREPALLERVDFRSKKIDADKKAGMLQAETEIWTSRHIDPSQNKVQIMSERPESETSQNTTLFFF